MNDKLKERVDREREFHNQEKDVSKKASDFKKLFKNYFLNPSLVEMEEYFNSVKNITNKSEDQVKQWIKEGTLTDKLLVSAIKNVMKERINNG